MSVSVRTRFEVFKRDRFTCSYCGRTPPEVLLECDHIVPRAAGGSDDIANLTTACATCNRGKAARLLEEGTAPVVGRATVEELAERVEQAKAYMELLGGLSTLTERQIGMVIDGWAHAFKAKAEERADGTVAWSLASSTFWPDEASIRRFLRSLSLADVLEAVDIAAAKFGGWPDYAAPRYFYGICHRAIREGRPVGAARPVSMPAEPTYDEGYATARDEIGQFLRNYAENGYSSIEDAMAAIWPFDE